MNPEIKALWLDALRSARYRQGKGTLQTLDGEFCCLGVLCDLAVKRGVIPKPSLGPRDEYGDAQEYEYGAEANPGTLPFEVMAWASLDDSNPRIDDGRTVYPEALSNYNDMRDASFAEIADLIEEYL